MTEKKSKTRTIEVEVRIDAPLDAVWKALTEASELARWFPPVAVGKTGLGEELLLSWGPEVQWHTQVVAFEPGKHLVWQDRAPQNLGESGTLPAAAPMVANWTFEAVAGGQVLVRLVQSGFGEGETWDDFYEGTDRGWRFFLYALRHYLQRHRGTKRDMVSVRRPARGGPTIPWKQVWGVDGFAPSPDASRFAPGAPFEVRLGAERLAGTVDSVLAPHMFWGRLGSLEDATLLVEMEPGREQLHCGIWLSTYGLPKERVADLQKGLTAMADRAFARPD